MKYLVVDEGGRFAQSAGIEGCPIQLALKRTKTFEGKGRKVVIVSTPTTRNVSRINEWYLRGDQRKFMVTCRENECGHFGPLMLSNLRWETGKPETAYLSCEVCGVASHEAQRPEVTWKGESAATS